MSEESTAAMQQDGALIIGARCTDDDCEWQPVGTDDPHHWDIVERLRLSHEDETGHQVTVETVEQRTILAEKMAMMDATLSLAEDQGIAIEWICPECEQTGEELGTANQCPDCGEYLREVLP